MAQVKLRHHIVFCQKFCNAKSLLMLMKLRVVCLHSTQKVLPSKLDG